MKKQIIYCKFIPRVFAMTIDWIILSLVISPLLSPISQYIFLYLFQDFFITNKIDVKNSISILTAIATPEFINYITPAKILTYYFYVIPIYIGAIGSYFVFFWRKFNATPGKMLLRIKVVDADDFSTPSTYRLIKRFLFYVTFLIGMWSILFDKRKMSFHDKVANTVVIKS